jgi:hypothetical protein
MATMAHNLLEQSSMSALGQKRKSRPRRIMSAYWCRPDALMSSICAERLSFRFSPPEPPSISTSHHETRLCG